MTSKQAEEAVMLERELRDIAGREKAQYRRHVLEQVARLLRDLIGADDDEPYVPADMQGED